MHKRRARPTPRPPSRVPGGRRRAYPDLVTYIRDSGDTQVNIAARVGVKQPSISRIVRGRGLPTPMLAMALAEYANIPLDSFVRVYVAQRLQQPHQRKKPRRKAA